MINFVHYDLKLTKYIFKKIPLIFFGFNIILISGGLVEYFQYICRGIARFHGLEGIETDSIVKEEKK